MAKVKKVNKKTIEPEIKEEVVAEELPKDQEAQVNTGEVSPNELPVTDYKVNEPVTFVSNTFNVKLGRQELCGMNGMEVMQLIDASLDYVDKISITKCK